MKPVRLYRLILVLLLLPLQPAAFGAPTVVRNPTKIQPSAAPAQATNLAPDVRCPTANATVDCGSPIEIVANVSDPEGDALLAIWSVNGSPVETNTVASGPPMTTNDLSLLVTPPVGTNIVTLTVFDTAGNSASCFTPVTVIDTEPPVITSASASRTVLWPPNHRLETIHITANASTTCGGSAAWKIIDVRSNERISGPGHSSPDFIITGPNTVRLRSERLGTGNGRVYSVILQAGNEDGVLSEPFTITVTVPKNQGRLR